MRGREFRARDKKVQKLGRDGLVEQNKATGEEHRVSQRTADISFGPERTTDQQLGRQTSKRSKKHSIRSELQSLKPDAGQVAPPAECVEPTEGLEKPLEDYAEAAPAEQEAAPVIRDTRGVPAPPPGRAAKQRNRRPRDSPAPGLRPPSDRPTPKRWQEAQRHTDDPMPETADSQEPQQQGRLRFEDGDVPAPSGRTPAKRRMRPSIPTGGTAPRSEERRVGKECL